MKTEEKEAPIPEGFNFWPDSVRFLMIEKSKFYYDDRIYQYGFYDGYQLQNEKIKQGN